MSDSSLLSSIRSSFATNASVTPLVTSSDVAATVPATPVIPPTQPVSAPTISTDDQLNVLGSVLDEIEATRQATPQVAPPVAPVPTAVPDVVPTSDLGQLAQVVPQTTLQSTDTLNPFVPVGGTAKETQARSALQEVAAETGIALQYVEQEKSPELSPEVESFLENVEENKDQAPQEIVIAGDQAQLPSTTHHPSQPVLVLPITPDLEKEGKHKNVHWSLRWLVEWSNKIIKIFSGKVIYRQV